MNKINPTELTINPHPPTKINDMKTIRHMSVNLEGILRIYKGKKINIFKDDNGRTLSDKEVRAEIFRLQSLGHKLMCCSNNCEGFDPFGGGCPGHEIIDNPMTTIYTRLSPLGFAEWVAVKVFRAEPDTIQEGIEVAIEEFKRIGLLDSDDTELTSWNALAFRWLREEKGIDCEPVEMHGKYENGVYYKGCRNNAEPFDTYELAEIACLERAYEIINSQK